MTLSKRGDYVVRSALALARAYPSGEARKIREVVAEMGVPQTFASQILADLVRAGLATSKAGKDGGYRLASPPEKVSLVEVVEAGEGPLRAERCALGEGPCRWDAVCPLHETWRTATDALRDVLRSTSLADLVKRDEDIEKGRIGAPEDPHRVGDSSIEVADSIQVEAGSAVFAGMARKEQMIADAISGAFEEVEELRSRIAGGGRSWLPIHIVSSASQRLPEGRAASGGSRLREDLVVGVSFEGSMPGGSSTHGDLAISSFALDPQRCELRAQGKVRLPRLGSAATNAALADPSVGEKLVQVLIRTMLRRIARDVEGAAAVSGRLGVPGGSEAAVRGDNMRKGPIRHAKSG